LSIIFLVEDISEDIGVARQSGRCGCGLLLALTTASTASTAAPREGAPLRQAEDAIVLDNSHLTIAEQDALLRSYFERATQD